MPKVSVCLPVYNGERYLAQAIESVLAQKHNDLELIIGDDGSSDSSLNIAKQYAAKDRRITVWQNERNLGLFGNYNECLRRASGEFLKPFAQDDLFDSNLLARQVDVLTREPRVRLVAAAKRLIDGEGRELKCVRQFADDRTIPGHEAILYNLLQLSNWIGEPSTVMFRSQDAGTGFDTNYYHYGDIEYWFRLVQHGELYYVSDPLCSFRRHAESNTTINHAGLYFALDIMRLGDAYWSYLEELGETKEHFTRRALEVIALQVDHLVQNGLTESDLLSSRKPLTDEQADQYRLLSFQALRYITSLIANYDALRCKTEADREHLEAKLRDLQESTSWKITAPLRLLATQSCDPPFPPL